MEEFESMEILKDLGDLSILKNRYGDEREDTEDEELISDLMSLRKSTILDETLINNEAEETSSIISFSSILNEDIESYSCLADSLSKEILSKDEIDFNYKMYSSIPFLNSNNPFSPQQQDSRNAEMKEVLDIVKSNRDILLKLSEKKKEKKDSIEIAYQFLNVFIISVIIAIWIQMIISTLL
ncbi:hypothetical protein ABK040_009808 [Willaertia magna]